MPNNVFEVIGERRDGRGRRGAARDIIYSDIVAERVPDRFAEILCKLDELSGDGARQMSRGRDKTGRLCKTPPSLLGACVRCRCFSVPSFGRGSYGDVVELVVLADLSDGAGMVGVELAGAS